MAFESDKTMFEIYREKEYNRLFRVVYFTELHEHNKETEINRALAGEHFFDGYISDRSKPEAKEIISSIVRRLNDGEQMTAADIRSVLSRYLLS